MITARDIENLIRESFPEAKITVQGDDGAHFAAEVIDASFKGMNRVQQQRAVYASLHWIGLAWVIAADGSACTKRVLAFIAAHDEWLGPQHRYTVLHCVPAIPHRAAAFVGKPQAQALYRDDAETVLRPIRTFLNRHLQGVTFVHRVGSPGSTIARIARERRIDLDIGIGYGDDVRKARDALLALARGHEKVLDDPAPEVLVTGLGESSVDLVLRAWTKTADYIATGSDLKEAVHRNFGEIGISIPFPQRDLHIYHHGADGQVLDLPKAAFQAVGKD